MKSAPLALDLLKILASNCNLKEPSHNIVKKAIELADEFIQHMETSEEWKARVIKDEQQKAAAIKAEEVKTEETKK